MSKETVIKNPVIVDLYQDVGLVVEFACPSCKKTVRLGQKNNWSETNCDCGRDWKIEVSVKG